MNKTIRILIAILLLSGILFLARGQMAGAGELPASDEIGPAQAGGAPAAAVAQPGTVRPPPDVVEIEGPGRAPVGGVCDVRVIRLAEGFTLTVDLHPFQD